MRFSGKCILVLSPQSWGDMFLSKHHYALELAKRGSKVFFLNPPVQNPGAWRFSTVLRTSGYHDNLWIIDHTLGFPYALKFKAKWLFDLLMRRHVAKLLKQHQLQPDIIWSFDIGNLYLLKHFPDHSYKIFHPVDEPNSPEAIRAAEGSNIIFSVTREILDKYRAYEVPRHFIHHGISDQFLQICGAYENAGSDGVIRVGFSGNLLRPDIDWEVFMTIVRSHPDIIFECFGSYEEKWSNIGGSETQKQKQSIAELKSLPNVLLHGVLSGEKLAHAYNGIDVWLICYDIQTDQSKGTNYHKVMEFLSTGKVIISNNITTYADDKVLVTMSQSRNNNWEMPGIFDNVIKDLPRYNSLEMQAYRKRFAFSNSYGEQVNRISATIASYHN